MSHRVIVRVESNHIMFVMSLKPSHNRHELLNANHSPRILLMILYILSPTLQSHGLTHSVSLVPCFLSYPYLSPNMQEEKFLIAISLGFLIHVMGGDNSTSLILQL